MSDLHLIRVPLTKPALLRFAAEQGITKGDDGLGYSLHLWLKTLFGDLAPQPFRYFDQRGEVLGYASADHVRLRDHAQTFAAPAAWSALRADDLASKPMPRQWRAGQRLRLEVLVCPVTRRGDVEKDAYLHALDQTGEQTPPRAEVYQHWFTGQWQGALNIEFVELRGMRARHSLLRRSRKSEERLLAVERPQALFAAQGAIADPMRFAELLARGIGRHRAFGFGMVLLSPPI